MARRFFAELNVDEDKYIAQTDGDVGIGDYLENEMGWVTLSGITMEEWVLADDDDSLDMQRYANYLFKWALNHSSDDIPCSPLSFEEWKLRTENEI